MTDKLVEKIEELPLSGDDLITIAKCLNMERSKWMLYDDLKNFKNLKELFGDDYEAIYILMQLKSDSPSQQSVGHWVCFIFHREKQEYYWYDSYAIPISKELSLTQEPDTIIKLTKNENLKALNTHRHQLFRDETNTCGRHCALRGVFWHLNNDEYHDLVIKPITPSHVRNADALVSLMTGLASKSDEPLIAFFNKKENKG